jgi:acetyl esterase/lipase
MSSRATRCSATWPSSRRSRPAPSPRTRCCPRPPSWSCRPGWTSLPPLDLYIGTADVFHPDTRRLHEQAAHAGVATRLTEVPGAFHVYVLAPVPEAHTAMHAIIATLQES